MNGYTLIAVLAGCFTIVTCVLIWAAVRLQQAKGAPRADKQGA
ncbi:hypothetical protein [Streptomyces sp. NPDC047097]